ncbi:MAG TPA: 3-dehydroquinate synthase [Candidatus Binatia bacterium]|jgi:3-dehydroquinate synthase|nr:3-dehydroquinate synthase [Candidatus Binatia bacterium]
MRTLTVNLGDRSYPIHVGEKLLPHIGEFLQQVGCRGKVGIVTNPTVAALYLGPVQEGLSHSGFKVTSILLPDGEEHKNLSALSTIYDRLIADRFERDAFIIALGGGVIGDMAGFAAATLLRGISYVQVPTTLLAQVDSSIGGKTGVNHQGGKNLIGAFYQPRLVVVDLEALRTLPRREFVSGLAEVIKCGIIADPELFALLEREMERLLTLEGKLLEQIVAASCAIKARIVEKDEHEADLRSVLNFGHTVGHALEAATRYGRFLHGEAVAIGMVCAASISVNQGACAKESFKRIRQLIAAAELPVRLPSDIRLPDIIKNMEVDKKSAGGRIKFVLCEGIGKTRFHWLSPEDVGGELTGCVNSARP